MFCSLKNISKKELRTLLDSSSRTMAALLPGSSANSFGQSNGHPMIINLSLRNGVPCLGLVQTSLHMSSVSRFLISISPWSTLSFVEKELVVDVFGPLSAGHSSVHLQKNPSFSAESYIGILYIE